MKKIVRYTFIITTLLIVSFLVLDNETYAQADTEITYGSEYVFNTASTSDISLDNLSSSKIIVAYNDGGSNFNQGTAIIANISDNTITYGSEYVFNSVSIDYVSVKIISENKAVIVYKDNGNSNYGTAIIANISDNTITYGSEYVFNTALTDNVSIAILSESKFVIVYKDSEGGFDQGKAIIGEINGNEITFGSEYVFNTASVSYVSVATLSENKFVLVYKDIVGGSQGTIIIGVVSDKDIDFGSKYVFNPADTRDISIVALSENKIAIAYKDQGGNNYGRAIIGEINNDLVSFGSEYVFNPAVTNFVSISSLSENKIAVAYQDQGNNYYGTAIIANISDNTITFGSEYVFNTANTGVPFTQILSQSKFFIAYQDKMSNFNYGTAIIGNIPVEEIIEPEPEPEPVPEPEPIIDLNNGDLIRNPNAEDLTKFDIYIVKIVGDQKFKRLILSPHVFESYEHLNWEDVKDVDQSTVNAYTISNLVRVEGDDKVYELFSSGDTGTKQWLNITAQEFTNQGYDSDSIYTINSVDIDSYE